LNGLPTQMVTRQLQVERRTGKVRRPKTDVLPLKDKLNVVSVLLSDLWHDGAVCRWWVTRKWCGLFSTVHLSSRWCQVQISCASSCPLTLSSVKSWRCLHRLFLCH